MTEQEIYAQLQSIASSLEPLPELMKKGIGLLQKVAGENQSPTVASVSSLLNSPENFEEVARENQSPAITNVSSFLNSPNFEEVAGGEMSDFAGTNLNREVELKDKILANTRHMKLAGVAIDDGNIFNPYIHRYHLPLQVMETLSVMRARGESTFREYVTELLANRMGEKFYSADSYTEWNYIFPCRGRYSHGVLKVEPVEESYNTYSLMMLKYCRSEIQRIEILKKRDQGHLLLQRYGITRIKDKSLETIFNNSIVEPMTSLRVDVEWPISLQLFILEGLIGTLNSLLLFPHRYRNYLHHHLLIDPMQNYYEHRVNSTNRVSGEYLEIRDSFCEPCLRSQDTRVLRSSNDLIKLDQALYSYLWLHIGRFVPPLPQLRRYQINELRMHNKVLKQKDAENQL